MPKATPSGKAAQTLASATSKWGLGGEAQAALLRVRTGPECPKGNLRELTWDSKPDCGRAIMQKALQKKKKKRCPFHYRGLECKSRKSRNPRVTGKCGLGIRNEAGQRLARILSGERTGHSKHPLPTTQEKTTHGHHQTVNTEIRLIIFFVAKNGEALYSQQKQDQELTVAHIMSSLLPNSDLNWRK